MLGALMAKVDYLSGYQRSRFAEGLGRLADRVHNPVLYLLPKQNRELPYASVRRGKPARGRQILVPVNETKYRFQ